MDLSDPNVLRATVRRIFQEEASGFALGIAGIPERSLEPLVTPGLAWRGDLGNVDEPRLREALREVARRLIADAGATPSVGPAAVEEALRAARCHYLWFC